MLRKLGLGRLIVVLFSSGALTFLAAAQAFTFAWLSAFPEQAARVEALEWRFWIYLVVTILLLAIDARLVFVVFQRLVRRDRTK